MSQHKVVTTDGVTANSGLSKPNQTGPTGLSLEVAEADARQRNADAEALGIKTRYVVADV